MTHSIFNISIAFLSGKEGGLRYHLNRLNIFQFCAARCFEGCALRAKLARVVCVVDAADLLACAKAINLAVLSARCEVVARDLRANCDNIIT